MFVFYLPKSLPFTKIGKKTLLSNKAKFSHQNLIKSLRLFSRTRTDLDSPNTSSMTGDIRKEAVTRAAAKMTWQTVKVMKYSPPKKLNTKVRAPLVTMAEAVFLFWVSRSSWEGRHLLAVNDRSAVGLTPLTGQNVRMSHLAVSVLKTLDVTDISYVM